MQGSASYGIAANGLACQRGDRLLFRKLSFDLSNGDALHITGGNGTGKTTLIRTLAGLMRAYSGTVETSGAIGLLDERMGLDPDLPLGKALSFWNRIDACKAPDEAIASMGLGPLLDVPVRYLSTGQRKRAGLAVLIARDVPILLLDEPLSGLDAAAIAQVSALIQRHVDGGGIAVIASHQELAIENLRTLAIEDFAPAEDAYAEADQ